MNSKFNQLPYDLSELTREKNKFYIGATDNEISEMLNSINKNSFDELFESIPDEVKHNLNEKYPPKEYHENISALETIASKNSVKPSFIGDSLRSFSVPEMTSFTCSLRGLTTAYTPYQPERSQGTLWTLWFYANTISKITGFEAINASLYDRSSALFEALSTAKKISKSNSNKALISRAIHPHDIEVVETLKIETNLEFDYIPLCAETGKTDINKLKSMLSKNEYYAIAFTQTNRFGIIEDFDLLTDLAKENNLKTICNIDILEINNAGLKKPSEFGKNKEGVDIIIGEGQHLALGPNFGGPGLGIFGVRYNEKNKLDIRSTPGRFVGKTVDTSGKLSLCMVLSTREQHIRREKATSNICSNQSFLATLVGASLLERGGQGLENILQQSKNNLKYFINKLETIANIEVAFKNGHYLNQVTLELNSSFNADELIKKISSKGILIGTNVSNYDDENKNRLLVSFNDIVTFDDINLLANLLEEILGKNESSKIPLELSIPDTAKGIHQYFPSIDLTTLKNFYHKLSKLNVSPDDNIYPLGSCTMKYNPHINDYTASLKGFTNCHPQAPIDDIQGSLEVLYEIQERFKQITCLPGVTTQPLAGAQGELVGIKMFQAFHRFNGEKRDIILIPKSAHGTNPATATMAGIDTYVENGQKHGIITIDADQRGQIDMNQLTSYIAEYGKRILGVMVTNPNTSGIFEENFKIMADKIHEVGGLVYMDGANMNAIAGIVDLKKLGVDAVHNNLHKTWTIPHGGGGPGDAIVAVSEKLVPFLPGHQVIKTEQGKFDLIKPKNSIGSFHRNFGNFAHKVRCLTYLYALGDQGVKKMSSVAVLSSVYLYEQLKQEFPILPFKTDNVDRMHEFIITLSEDTFKHIATSGIAKAQIIGKLGKLFLDFGIHAPTVSFPEPFGLMIEPTESYSKSELDNFFQVLKSIKKIIQSNPEVLHTVPHFTPIKKVDEVKANKDLNISDDHFDLPNLDEDKISPLELKKIMPNDLCEKIVLSHLEQSAQK